MVYNNRLPQYFSSHPRVIQKTKFGHFMCCILHSPLCNRSTFDLYLLSSTFSSCQETCLAFNSILSGERPKLTLFSVKNSRKENWLSWFGFQCPFLSINNHQRLESQTPSAILCGVWCGVCVCYVHAHHYTHMWDPYSICLIYLGLMLRIIQLGRCQYFHFTRKLTHRDVQISYEIHQANVLVPDSELFVKPLLLCLSNISCIIFCPKNLRATPLLYQYVRLALMFLDKTLFSEPNLNTYLSLKSD